MSILQLPKTIDEIEKGKVMPTDWYVFQIIKEPEVKPNAHAKAIAGGKALFDGAAPDPSKAGNNFVIELAVVHEDPDFNGRSGFWSKRYLALPNEADKEKQTQDGQSIEDFKMDNIVREAEAFMNQKLPPGTDQVNFEVGMRACYYVLAKQDENGRWINEIDMNKPPQPAL